MKGNHFIDPFKINNISKEFRDIIGILFKIESTEFYRCFLPVTNTVPSNKDNNIADLIL